MRGRIRGSHRSGDDGMPMTHPASGSSSGRSAVIGGSASWRAYARSTTGLVGRRATLRRCVIGAADPSSPGATPRRAAPDVSGARARPSGVLKSEAARSSTLRLRDPRAADLGTLRFRVPMPGHTMRSATAEAGRSTWCKKSQLRIETRARSVGGARQPGSVCLTSARRSEAAASSRAGTGWSVRQIHDGDHRRL